jgi:hypothetical protein
MTSLVKLVIIATYVNVSKRPQNALANMTINQIAIELELSIQLIGIKAKYLKGMIK